MEDTALNGVLIHRTQPLYRALREELVSLNMLVFLCICSFGGFLNTNNAWLIDAVKRPAVSLRKT